MTTIAQTKTPFEQFVTGLVVQVKRGATFTAEELHRHLVAFASKEGVRFTPDEAHSVMACFSSHEGAPATATFSTSAEVEEQPRDTHMRGRYRGEALTPEYRQHLLGDSPLGRQILKDEDAAQPRDAQGRYQSHATGAPSASTGGQGAATVTNEYRRQEQVYSEICHRVFNQEGAALGQADSRR